MRTYHVIAHLLFIAQLATPHGPQQCTASPSAPALDHTIIVVRDLDDASSAFREHGFRIKQGRVHANGLLNRHIKFRDGSEIELMTVQGTPGDAMAQRYADLLSSGEGGVYVALKVKTLDDATRIAAELKLDTRTSGSGPWQFLGFSGLPAAAVFFSTGDAVVQDADSIFDHRPRATGLAEVWLEGGPELGELLRRLGAVSCGSARVSDGRSGERWALSRGSIVIVAPVTAATRPRVLGAILTTPSQSSGVVHPRPYFWLQYR